MIARTAFLVSLLVGLVLQPLAIAWLRRRGVLDIPNRRSSHTLTTPRGGGIAVLAALSAGFLVGRDAGWDLAVVMLGAVALGAVGLLDDFRGLNVKVRLSSLLLVGAFVGLFLSPHLPMALAVAAGALWVSAYVNAFNFMDGINGISAFTGLVSGVAYGLMGQEFGSPASVVIGAALAGASASFLPFNAAHAKVFLGDVGSYSIGFVIAALGWIVWSAGAPLALALAPAAVYLADTGTTLLRRYRNSATLTEAHREHTYQRFAAEGGRSHLTVAMAVAALDALVVALVWWGYYVGDWFAWLGMGTALAVLVIPIRLSARMSGPPGTRTTC